MPQGLYLAPCGSKISPSWLSLTPSMPFTCNSSHHHADCQALQPGHQWNLHVRPQIGLASATVTSIHEAAPFDLYRPLAKHREPLYPTILRLQGTVAAHLLGGEDGVRCLAEPSHHAMVWHHVQWVGFEMLLPMHLETLESWSTGVQAERRASCLAVAAEHCALNVQ